MKNSCVQLGLFEDRVCAHITLPQPDIQRANEVIRTIKEELGEIFCDELDITPCVADGTCTIRLIVNPHAPTDTLERMLLVQWMVKRLAMFSPPLDLSNLHAMQSTFLH